MKTFHLYACWSFACAFVLLVAACSLPTSPTMLAPTGSPVIASPTASLSQPLALTPTAPPSPPTRPPLQNSPTPSSASTAQLTALTCLEHMGHYEQAVVPVSGTSDLLLLRIYLPPCYDFDTSRRYPVLYLFHGYGYTEDQWQRLGAGETLESLLAAGAAPPFIIVMPFDSASTEPDINPLASRFIEIIVPWVDDTYRTLAVRQYRAVGGLSRGAGWAVHFGLQNWQTFSAIGAHSLALFWYDSRYVSTWLDAIPEDQFPRFYLDMGSSDKQLNEVLYSFLADLDRHNVPHEWHLFRGYHDEVYWRSHVENYLRWYAAGWTDLIP